MFGMLLNCYILSLSVPGFLLSSFKLVDIELLSGQIARDFCHTNQYLIAKITSHTNPFKQHV